MRPAENDLVQQTLLTRYLGHVLVATLAVAGLPLWLAYVIAATNLRLPLLLVIALSTAASLGLARVGAAIWERRPGSRDLVFDDLMAWGYLRRLSDQNRVRRKVRRLSLHRSGQNRLLPDRHTRILRSLATALEAGDPYTHGHSTRIARHCCSIAVRLKLPKHERDKIRLAAALHDVGKLNIPRDVLHKPERLSDDEYEIVKQHPAIGAGLVAPVGDPELAAMIRHHHERIDGSGYPDGLAGQSIPLGARIIAVADTFDAITSRRPYRRARKHKDALDILKQEAGTQLDPDVVRAFLSYYRGTSSMRWWLSLTATFRGLQEFSLGALGGTVANAAVLAGAAALVTVGGARLAPAPLSAPFDQARARARSVVSDRVERHSSPVASDERRRRVEPARSPSDPARSTTRRSSAGTTIRSSSPSPSPSQSADSRERAKAASCAGVKSEVLEQTSGGGAPGGSCPGQRCTPMKACRRVLENRATRGRSAPRVPAPSKGKLPAGDAHGEPIPGKRAPRALAPAGGPGVRER